MNKKLLFSLLLAGTAFTGHADEARLLRFPATNGSDIVFSYAGDLYKAPLNGGNTDFVVIYEAGAFDPIASNETLEGRARNRRLDIYLIPGEKMVDMARRGELDKR